MPFSIRRFRRFLLQCDVMYHIGSWLDATMTDIRNDRV